MMQLLGTLALGYLFCFAIVIGFIAYRQTEKTLEFLSFYFFAICFGWSHMVLSFSIGLIIMKLLGAQ